MLSIECTHAAVVACHASPAALDSLPAADGAFGCRVAPDELLLVAPAAQLAESVRQATEYFARIEPSALVCDQSDGWSAFSLRGDEAPSVFAQLSAVPLPREYPAFAQGAVAGGGAKILSFEGVIHLLVPSTLRHHVATRLQDVSEGGPLLPDSAGSFGSGTTAPSDIDGAAAPALR